MPKVLIFGGRGFLGVHLKTLYPDALTPACDIANRASVSQILDAYKPDVVINAAGKTGVPNVDWCEDHKLETVRSNVTGPLILLDECAARSIYWVHLGSGCIYEGVGGGRGFAEEDAANFSGSFYARSKTWTDQILREFPVLQLRLRMPFDSSDNPRNLIVKLRRYERVLDAQNSLTCVGDFLEAAKILIEKRKTGIYNIVNTGTISPYDIMSKYRQIVDPAHRISRLTREDLPSVVKAGRSNCTLRIEKLEREGIVMRPVEEAVEEALVQIARRMAIQCIIDI